MRAAEAIQAVRARAVMQIRRKRNVNLTGSGIMRRGKLNNKGSAIVSVIVVTTFITILATTVLYVTCRNYMVKQNDYQNKITFYQAEQTLDDLKAMLAEDISAACMYAYKETMVNYVGDNSSSKRAERYNKAFVDYMEALWEEDKLPDGTSNAHANINGSATRVKALIEQYSAYSGKDVAEIEKHIINTKPDDAGTVEGSEGTVPDIGFEKDEAKGQFVITGVVVCYAEKGYATYIKTDIGLNAPAYNWGNWGSTAGEADDKTDETLRMGDYIVYRNWEKY